MISIARFFSLIAAAIVLGVLLVPPSAGALEAAVSIPPMAAFARAVGGDQVSVTVMSPPGADPHTYEPSPAQMKALSMTDVYLAVGVAFERVWLPRFQKAAPGMEVVHTDARIRKIPMAAHGHGHKDGHEHGHEHEGHEAHGHDHDAEHGGRGLQGSAGLDPHVWTSPRRVMAMAKAILEGFTRADPGNQAAYESGYESFLEKLERMDDGFQDLFADKQGESFLVFHPAWGYLAHDYGFVQVPIEVEGKEPKPSQLARIINAARDSGARVVFVQPQIYPDTARVVAREIGARVVEADPLARDWAPNLRRVARELADALH